MSMHYPWAQASVPPGGHQLPPLPYPYNALEPVISAGALYIHHDRHHRNYVEGLNRAELKLAEARRERDFSLLKHWARELAFHGSGHVLHSIFWTVMTPLGGGHPGPRTQREITGYFGSFPVFKEQFSEAASQVEASGWAVLIWHPAWKRMEILTAEKHQDFTQWGGIPILVLDAWEHAYYLDYQNKRDDYIEAWWRLVNWAEVERRLLLAEPAGLPLTPASY